MKNEDRAKCINNAKNYVASVKKSLEQMENNLKPTAVNIGCSTPNTLNLLKRGLKYTYVFYDKANIFLSE